MPEYINQWAAEYLPGVIFSFALWTLGAAAVGFLAGIILFLFLRLIGLYRLKFQLGGLVAFLLLIYTAFVTTVAFGSIGFFESAKRQSDEVLASPENRQMLGEVSGALSSRATSLAYAYGIQAQASGETKPNFSALIQKANAFDKGQWGIDLKKSDAAFDQITDEVIQENYESIYGFLFKDIANDENSNLEHVKTALDFLIQPENLTGNGLTTSQYPCRNKVHATKLRSSLCHSTKSPRWGKSLLLSNQQGRFNDSVSTNCHCHHRNHSSGHLNDLGVLAEANN